MTDLRQAAQQALEALESDHPDTQLRAAIALRAALAEPEQEPVAWKDKTYGNLHHQDFGNSIPLYAAPPQRPAEPEEPVAKRTHGIHTCTPPHGEHYEVDYSELARELMWEIERVLRIVDNIGDYRQDLIEESIKELDRNLSALRGKRTVAASLEEKLAIMKDERALEHIRKQRRDWMFEVIEDGAIYAVHPLARYELDALLAPMRKALENYRKATEGDSHVA